MLAATRRARIVELLRQERALRSEEVAHALGVSVETIRRDLEQLDHAGELVRVHGGAIPIEMATATEPTFEARNHLALESKQAIGQAAIELLSGVQTIFLDVGTTAMQVAAALPPSISLTVVTPSMRVAEILTPKQGVTVLVPGGQVRAGDLAISGASAVDYLADIFPDVALLGSGGLSVERGLTDFVSADVPVKRAALQNSVRTYVLADADKLGVLAPYRVCDIGDLTGVIIDRTLSDEAREPLVSAGLEVIAG